jgi:predicted metal-binding membrane protein
LFVPVLAGLIALAWAVLWAWERSPYGRYLNHRELAEICATGGLGVVVQQAALYALGWTLMIAAMMLPTTLPLIDIFRRLTQQRPDQLRLVALVIASYLGVWAAFGIGVHALDLGLHELLARNTWLWANPWVFGVGPLLVAGGFQFSRLKYRCLDKCRAPLSFVMQHWRGGNEHIQALLIGAHHGLFCVGCCWALMLLMFAVGTGNLGWMLGLGAVMALEKNMPWGRKLSAPLGVALLAWGGLIAVNHLWT